MKIGFVSLFPAMFQSLGSDGVVGRALQAKLWQQTIINPRDFATDRRRSVDDLPYGGGAGMVLKPEPLGKAIEHAKQQLSQAKVTYLSPAGVLLTDKFARQLATEPEHILICGRYLGIDQRIIDSQVDREISVGNFIVSGGELPAMMLADAILRFIPGVLGEPESLEQESFVNDKLAPPCYTRPDSYKSMSVPEVLKSGDHQQINNWREQASQERMAAKLEIEAKLAK